MILNCDKFFVEELQKYGYDIDYKKIMDIYIRLLEIQKVLKKDKLKKKENLLNYKSILLNFITNVSSSKLAFFYAFLPLQELQRSTSMVAHFLCQFLNLHVDGQCLKNSTLVLLKFLFVKSNYFYSALICVLRADISFQV